MRGSNSCLKLETLGLLIRILALAILDSLFVCRLALVLVSCAH